MEHCIPLQPILFQESKASAVLVVGVFLWLSGKESACNAEDAGDAGSIPGSGRSSGGGHGNPLQYSCLEKPVDRGAWCLTVHGVVKSRTRLGTEEHKSNDCE